jgi:hypothetical protein
MGHQVDTLGRAAGVDDLRLRRGADEGGDLAPGLLVALGGQFGQAVDGAMTLELISS